MKNQIRAGIVVVLVMLELFGICSTAFANANDFGLEMETVSIITDADSESAEVKVAGSKEHSFQVDYCPETRMYNLSRLMRALNGNVEVKECYEAVSGDGKVYKLQFKIPRYAFDKECLLEDQSIEVRPEGIFCSDSVTTNCLVWLNGAPLSKEITSRYEGGKTLLVYEFPVLDTTQQVGLL